MRKSNNFTREERNHLRQILQEKTGYCFRKNSGVLIQAFTRSSYTAMCGGENNEVLEFIGDQVMSYYLTRQIVARCGALNYAGEFSFRIRENRFTVIKQEPGADYRSVGHCRVFGGRKSRSNTAY